MRVFRDYLVTMGTTTALFLSVVAGLNFAIDPLSCYGTVHPLNQRRTAFNERQQKTNRLMFAPPEFDAVLLGNSRVTYINQNDFSGYKVFNYSANFMTTDEFGPLIRFAKKRATPTLRTAILGMSFHVADSNQAHDEQGFSAESAIRQVEDPLYRFKTLLSWDVAGKSWSNLAMNALNHYDQDWYDLSNVKSHRATDERYMLSRMTYNMRMLQRRVRHQFRYDPGYRENMRRLLADNPGVRFVVFTAPASTSIMEILRQEGRLADYHRWLRETIEVFGGLHHFEYPNTVTRDVRNFVDGHHFTPEIGRMIAKRVSGVPDPAVPADFGIYLTSRNLDAFLSRTP